MRAPLRVRLSPRRLGILLVAALIAVLAAWYVHDTRAELERQQRQSHADCAYVRDVARAPALVATPGQGLLLLAHDARVAYVGKGCEDKTGPPPTAYPTMAPRP